MARERLHRITFIAAAVYNIVWGVFTALNPQWLFRFAEMPEMRHPAIFACLGMVVGLYGLLYAEVARCPERGFVIAAVGLAGKVMGPMGWLLLLLRGEWPAKTIVLILSNDLIWWIPFGLYLIDSWTWYGKDLRE